MAEDIIRATRAFLAEEASRRLSHESPGTAHAEQSLHENKYHFEQRWESYQQSGQDVHNVLSGSSIAGHDRNQYQTAHTWHGHTAEASEAVNTSDMHLGGSLREELHRGESYGEQAYRRDESDVHGKRAFGTGSERLFVSTPPRSPLFDEAVDDTTMPTFHDTNSQVVVSALNALRAKCQELLKQKTEALDRVRQLELRLAVLNTQPSHESTLHSVKIENEEIRSALKAAELKIVELEVQLENAKKEAAAEVARADFAASLRRDVPAAATSTSHVHTHHRQAEDFNVRASSQGSTPTEHHHVHHHYHYRSGSPENDDAMKAGTVDVQARSSASASAAADQAEQSRGTHQVRNKEEPADSTTRRGETDFDSHFTTRSTRTRFSVRESLEDDESETLSRLQEQPLPEPLQRSSHEIHGHHDELEIDLQDIEQSHSSSSDTSSAQDDDDHSQPDPGLADEPSQVFSRSTMFSTTTRQLRRLESLGTDFRHRQTSLETRLEQLHRDMDDLERSLRRASEARASFVSSPGLSVHSQQSIEQDSITSSQEDGRGSLQDSDVMSEISLPVADEAKSPLTLHAKPVADQATSPLAFEPDATDAQPRRQNAAASSRPLRRVHMFRTEERTVEATRLDEESSRSRQQRVDHGSSPVSFQAPQRAVADAGTVTSPRPDEGYQAAHQTRNEETQTSDQGMRPLSPDMIRQNLSSRVVPEHLEQQWMDDIARLFSDALDQSAAEHGQPATASYARPTMSSRAKARRNRLFNDLEFKPVPFVVGTSTTPSQSLGGTLQAVFAELKQRLPAKQLSMIVKRMQPISNKWVDQTHIHSTDRAVLHQVATNLRHKIREIRSEMDRARDQAKKFDSRGDSHAARRARRQQHTLSSKLHYHMRLLDNLEATRDRILQSPITEKQALLRRAREARHVLAATDA